MKSTIKTIRKTSGHFGAIWGEFVINNPLWVLLLSFALVFALGSGAIHISFDPDYRVYFREDNPQRLAYEEIQRKYTQDDNVLIVIEPKDGVIFKASTLQAIEALTEESWQVPYSTRVDAVTNFQHTYAEGDELFVENLVMQAKDLSAQEANDIQKIALGEPLLVHRLINESGTVAAVNITVKLPGEELTETTALISYVREMANTFEQEHPNLTTHLSGMAMLNGAFQEAAEQDSFTLIPLMFLVIIVAIFFSTRTISGTLVALLVVIFSIMAGMGFAGHAGIKLTSPSAAAPIIIMTLAVADSVHILVTMIQGLQRGLTRREAIIESLRLNFMPVFITSLTTVIGFLSMNTAEVPPFRDLGNITAVGMTVAFLLSVSLLPALMSVLPVKVRSRYSENVENSSFYTRIANFVITYRVATLWGTLVVISTLGYFAISIEMNDEFVKYLDESVPFRQDTDFINDNLTGINNVEFSVGSGEPGGINNPKYLQHLENFEHWLEKQPEIVHVNTYAEIARRVNKSMHSDNPSYYRLPDNREEAAQYLLLYELSLPFGLDLNNQINVDKSETRLTATFLNLPSNEMIAFTQRAEQWLVDNTPEYMHAKGTSPGLMFAHLSRTQINSLMKGTVAALLLISLILIVVLRSVKYGLLSLISNLTPAFAGFGLWALFGGQINIGISMVFGMTLGIIVDDTIHFLSKYLGAIRQYGYSPEEAIRYAFQTVGRALLVTTLILVGGFVVLSQSNFGLNSGMAKVTSLVIVFALLIDFLLLPALLLLSSRPKPVLVK